MFSILVFTLKVLKHDLKECNPPKKNALSFHLLIYYLGIFLLFQNNIVKSIRIKKKNE